MDTLPNRLLAARKSRPLSREKLAVLLDLSAKTIQRYEEGITEPDPHFLPKIADALGVRVEWLRDGTGEMVRPMPASRVEGNTYLLDTPSENGAHILHTSKEVAHIPPHLLRRAIVQQRVDQSLLPLGDGFIADREEVVMRVGSVGVKRTEMPTDGFSGYIERGAPLDVIPCDDFAGEGVYFLLLDGRTTVARVQPIGGRGYRLSYDNPSYLPLVLIPVDGDNTYAEPESGLVSTLEFTGRIEGSFRRH